MHEANNVDLLPGALDILNLIIYPFCGKFLYILSCR